MNMENLSLVSSPKMVLGLSQNPEKSMFNKPFLGFNSKPSNGCRHQKRSTSISVVSHHQGPKSIKILDKRREDYFASISSSADQQTSSVGISPQIPVRSLASHVVTPLFWIGVGVGLSALLPRVATNLKKYAMQQAFKILMRLMNMKSKESSDAAFSAISLFPRTPPPTSTTTTSPPSFTSQPMTVDVSATKVEKIAATDVKSESEMKQEPDKYGRTYPLLSLEALEKMMQTPTVQKMVYPYLPEEMRSPTTFKWMLQSPMYRQLFKDMLGNMAGSPEWGSKMMDALKNLDLDRPEMKLLFGRMGLTPEEAISKIMANPDIAMAFDNPGVQAAIMDCLQNPLNIDKYQNDKEVKDIFNKISALFLGVTVPS